jgi:cytochrome c556
MRIVLAWGVVVLMAGAVAGIVAVDAVAEDAAKKEKAPSAGEAKSDSKGEDCYQFVAPLEAIMEVMDGVFQKMPDKLKAEKFKDLKRESFFVAEVANLATHVKEFRGKKEFLALADAMKTMALKMAEAAEKKDESGVKTLHGKIEQTCDTCHEKFRDN